MSAAIYTITTAPRPPAALRLCLRLRLTLLLLLPLLLLALAPAGWPMQAVAAEGDIVWGEPVNGIRLGVREPVPTAPSAEPLGFVVVVQNVSQKPVTLPSPKSLQPVQPARPGRPGELMASTLNHVVVRVTKKYPYTGYRLSQGTYEARSATPLGAGDVAPGEALVRLEPGASAEWPASLTYQRWEDVTGKEVRVTTSIIYPDCTATVRFRLENAVPRAGGADLWTGEALSGETNVEVLRPSAGPHKLEAQLTLPKTKYKAGEPMIATFTVINHGTEPVSFPTGGDYRSSGRADRYSISAVNRWGIYAADPVAWRYNVVGGGLLGGGTSSPGKPYTEELILTKWCDFKINGTYTITCQRTLNIYDPNQPYAGMQEEQLPKIPLSTFVVVDIEGGSSGWMVINPAFILVVAAAFMCAGVIWIVKRWWEGVTLWRYL